MEVIELGMFDYVKLKIPCPVCGRIVDGFQTKNADNLMDELIPGKSIISPQLGYLHTYSSCIHRIERGRMDWVVDVTKAVRIDVLIPVNKDGTISKDKRRYKIKHEITDGGWGLFITKKKKMTDAQIERFNKKMARLEKEAIE